MGESPTTTESSRLSQGGPPAGNGPFLIYCICESGSITGSLPSGCDGLPVEVVDGEGLAAVVSLIDALGSAALRPDLPRVLAYQAVVEAVHRLCPVLPMRFGSVTAGRPELLHWLHRRRELFLPVLRELRGFVEMGVRVLLRDPRSSPPAPTAIQERTPWVGTPLESTGACPGPGLAFLCSRRRHLAAQDAWARQQEAVADEIHTALRGLFVRHKTELASFGGQRSVAVHFLVPRLQVKGFVLASHGLRGSCPGNVIVTGPWPPYNFVPAWDPMAGA